MPINESDYIRLRQPLLIRFVQGIGFQDMDFQSEHIVHSLAHCDRMCLSSVATLIPTDEPNCVYVYINAAELFQNAA